MVCFNRFGWLGLLILALLVPVFIPGPALGANGFIVYGVQNNLNMGNPGESTYRDLYINMGSRNGIKVGSVVDVFRTAPTYDLVNKKLLKEVSFKIAKAKVIHVEDEVAIARLTQMNPPEQTPVAIPNAVMVGDPVRVGQ